MRWIPAVALCLLCACSGSAGSNVRVRLDDPDITLNLAFDVRRVIANAAIDVRSAEPISMSPSGRMMGTRPGDRTVLWLYHFKSDNFLFRDRDRAWTLAFELPDLEPRSYTLPHERVRAVLFCDNWGGGFTAAWTETAMGTLRVSRDAAGRCEGSFSLRMTGTKQHRDGSTAPLSARTDGWFVAEP